MTDSQQADPSTHARRGLGLLLASAGVAIVGQGMATAAAPLLAASLTRNPVLVSAVTAANYVAWLGLGLHAGALVDRWPRRTTMVVTDLGRALVLTLLTVLILTESASIWALITAVFLIGVGSCFFDPASQALIPTLVGRDRDALSRANGKLWGIDNFGRSLAGPPLGSLAFAVAAALPFGVEATAFLASALMLLGIRGVDGRPRSAAAIEPVSHAVRAGVSFLVRHGELRMLALGMAAYNLGFNIAFAPLVLFAQDILGVSDAGYGFLVAATAIGGIAGGWAAPRISPHARARTVYAGALTTQAACWLLVLVTSSQWVAPIWLAIIGLTSTTVSVVGGSARQLLTPDDMLGRVTSGTRLLGIGSAGLGALLGGVVADVAGLSAPFIAAGLVLAVSGAVFWWRR
jgi:MFS family permease